MECRHLSVDSATSKTAWKSGIIALPDELPGKDILWLVCNCMLRTNEDLDGKRFSKTNFSGPFGKDVIQGRRFRDIETNFN